LGSFEAQFFVVNLLVVATSRVARLQQQQQQQLLNFIFEYAITTNSN